MSADPSPDPHEPAPRPWESWADAALLGALLAGLVAHLRPDLLLAPTTPTGGDMGSHYATAVYLREQLLPQGRISGWAPGNYAGFPILQFYFPLSFLLMMTLSLVCPLPVAFKLGSLLGTVGLPLASYALIRCLGYRFPIPVLAALATPVFLFQEGNSMWGGNLLSTLAGEFAYSLGLTLALLFLGTAWRGAQNGRGVGGNAALLALVGLAHGYTLLFAGLCALGLIALTPRPWATVRYLLAVYALAFALLGVWILPLLVYLPFATVFAPAWFIKDWAELAPVVIVPLTALAGLGGVWLLVRRLVHGRPVERPTLYLWYGVGLGAAAYWLGPWLGVVDVRFIPFAQLLLVILGAVFLGQMLGPLRGGRLAALCLVTACSVWAVEHSAMSPSWLAWNYGGAERTPLWPAFSGVNRVLAGDANEPRVVYEHSMVHNGAGSPRAFESLPLFSGRSTLEGLYLQASPSAPFVFYLQAELSTEASCPFTHLACTHANLDHALRHLRLFNVREIVAVSDQLKRALRQRAEVQRLADFSPYEIYRIQTPDPPGYVEPLRFEPVLITTRPWKQTAYDWFRRGDQLDVSLVFPAKASAAQLARFTLRDPEDLRRLPRRPIDLPDRGPVRVRVSEDRIEFETPYVGRPHLVRMSYHPKWRVEGAEALYLVSPSFMLVYPEREHVRLTYAAAWPDWVGGALTGAGLLALGVLWVRSRLVPSTATEPSAAPEPLWLVRSCRALAGALPVLLLAAGLGLYWTHPSPYVLLNEGIQARDRKEFAQAADLLTRVLRQVPASGAAEQAAYYLATVPYLQGKMEETIGRFRSMIDAFPSSPFVAEGYYHIGLAHLKLNQPALAREAFELILREFPESAWAGFARDRLAELDASGRFAGQTLAVSSRPAAP